MKVKDILKYSQNLYKKYNISIEELANKLKLDLTKKIEDLSYGNKKKVGIVDAILSDGDIYIFHETTGGLNPLIQEEFLKIIEDLKLKGKTIIYSAHVLSEVKRLCDRVCIIKDGKIIKVEEISDINEMKLKHVILKVRNEEKINIEGAMDIKYEKNNIRFSHTGDINKLMSELGKLNIVDIHIENPSLEEVFLNFMKDDLEKLTEMMEVMPKALLAAFGMDNLNMTKIEGFYESKGHLIVILMGSIFAVYLSSSLLVKEEDDKTIEYLLSKPITRNEIYCAKYMAFITIITMVKGEVAFEFKMESGIVVQAFGELYNEFKAELEVDYNRYVLLTNELLLKNIDYSKFKEDVNVNKVLEIIIYVSEGLNNKFIAQYKGDYKEIMKNTVKIREEALSYIDIIIKG
ncbi:ABC transporter permease subunit [Clostridium gasigenes]|nr:ABC transporter permease subunit [Clostridium gasigenes]